MPRPSLGRVKVSHYLDPGNVEAIRRRAGQRAEPLADTLRVMLVYADEHMPDNWQPKKTR